MQCVPKQELVLFDLGASFFDELRGGFAVDELEGENLPSITLNKLSANNLADFPVAAFDEDVGLDGFDDAGGSIFSEEDRVAHAA